MTMRPLPDAEQLASKFLRADPYVLATSLADRTFTELPKTGKVWPACRITRVGGDTDLDALLDRPLLQFDVWGGPKADAQRIAQTIRTRLAQGLPFQSDEGALRSVRRIGGLRYLPDTTEDPARPRYVFDVEFLTSA